VGGKIKEIAIFGYIICETMTKQAIMERTLEVISQFPVDKAGEISDFADFVRKRHEEQQLTEGIHILTEKNAAFEFRKTRRGFIRWPI
jgi:hypothetical protein